MSFVRRLDEDINELTILNFTENVVNALDNAYKVDYLQKLTTAIINYLAWMDRNASRPVYLGRCSHFRHGPSGKERTVKLLNLMKEGSASFFEIVKQTGAASEASAITQHSFRRYYFQAMTSIPVVDRLPELLADGDFFNLFNETISDEFLLKRGKLPKDFSHLALTEGVRVNLKNSIDDELTSDSSRALSTFQA